MSITHPLSKSRAIFGNKWCVKIRAVSSITGSMCYCFTGGRGSRTMPRWMAAMLLWVCGRMSAGNPSIKAETVISTLLRTPCPRGLWESWERKVHNSNGFCSQETRGRKDESGSHAFLHELFCLWHKRWILLIFVFAYVYLIHRQR